MSEQQEQPMAVVPPSVIELHVIELSKSLESILNGQQLDAVNITIVCLRLMTVVEGFPKLTGAEKQEIVMRTFQTYFASHENSQSQVLLSMLPSFMSAAVSIDKGEVVIHINPAKCCGLRKNKKSKK